MNTTATTTKSDNVQFLTINEFKVKMNLGSEEAKVIRNPNGENRLFLAIGSQTFKCQQNIDATKDIKIGIWDNDIETACLINAKDNSANVVFVL
jgi:hypothetical protein